MYLLRTLKNFTFIGFGTSFARGFALVNSLIIARVLGPSIFGIFSIFYAVMILSWQLPQAFDGVFVSMAKKTDIKADKIQYLKSAIANNFVLSIGFFYRELLFWKAKFELASYLCIFVWFILNLSSNDSKHLSRRRTVCTFCFDSFGLYIRSIYRFGITTNNEDTIYIKYYFFYLCCNLDFNRSF
jgi:hypothetical protein